MEKNNQSSNPAVAIPLSKRNKNLAILGSCLLMLFVAMSGSALAVLQSLFLTELNGMEYFAIAAVFGSVGIAIMTPIGGALGDIVGRKTMLIVPPMLAIISLLGLTFSKTMGLFLTFRLLLALMQGAFTASPYILVNLISERKDVPKYMGFLASSIALGTFGGPFLAGVLSDAGYLKLGISFPVIFLFFAIICFAVSLPKMERNPNVKLDVKGMIVLTVFIASLILTLNYASGLGWTNPLILSGIVVAVVSLWILIKVETDVENKGERPIIAMSLFKNTEYTVLLIIGLSCYYYNTIMLTYGSLAAFQIVGSSATVVGLLSMPRTIITMILPTFTGIWVGKKKSNSWKAMAIASGLVALVMIPFTMITSTVSIMLFFVSFGLTGIAESFRAVSITPAAQATLKPEELSTGTALINFVNSLASVTAASFGGLLFNSAQGDVVNGVRNAFLSAVVVSVIGFLLVVFFIRKKHTEEA